MNGGHSSLGQGGEADRHPVRLRNFFLVAIALVLCFAVPLYDLTRNAFRSDLYSYILLIPFISGYLVWSRRQRLPRVFDPAWSLAACFLAGGLAAVAGYWLTVHFASKVAVEDYLTFNVLSFLLFFVSACCLFFGKEILRAIVFPLCLLVFMIPFPGFLLDWIDTFLQYGSAMAANAMFTLSGTPFFHSGLVFQLPGITLEVAPECSGIHSTLVLFITSLLAGYLFLHDPWKRTWLVLAVIPLALLRNGFRIFVIGQLCVHIGPEMINSPIHRHGGPLFFALSLIPFFLFLIYLRKSERMGKNSAAQKPKI